MIVEAVAITVLMNTHINNTNTTTPKNIENKYLVEYRVTPEFLEEKKNTEDIQYNIPNDINTSFKGYMDYRTITDKTSKQWEMQQIAWTDSNGLRRINDDYCVALGTAFVNECGVRFKVTLDTGDEFTVIVSDIKNPLHTDETNTYVVVTDEIVNIVEFIIDIETLPQKAKTLGDVSCLGFEGNIEKIEKITEVID